MEESCVVCECFGEVLYLGGRGTGVWFDSCYSN